MRLVLVGSLTQTALIFLRCLRSRWFAVCSMNPLTEEGGRAVIRTSSICDGRDGVLGPCSKAHDMVWKQGDSD